MNMINVQSSRIKAYGYDTVRKELVIEFNRGGTYAFKNVPAEVVDKMGKAESIGSFFELSIRGQFESERVDAETHSHPASHDQHTVKHDDCTECAEETTREL